MIRFNLLDMYLLIVHGNISDVHMLLFDMANVSVSTKVDENVKNVTRFKF
jgi:hypothetical protein